MERLALQERPELAATAPAVGQTALELLAQPLDIEPIDMTGPAPPPTPPTPFPTEPAPTGYDIYGNPDVGPPDEEWLYE